MSKFILIEGEHLNGEEDMLLNVDHVVGATKGAELEISLTVVGSNANFRLRFIDEGIRDAYWERLLEICQPLGITSISRAIK